MERKYPAKMFWLFVLTNFLFHFFYLFVPGAILCVVGIWVRPCLWIGLAVLLLDLIVSIADQIQIKRAVMNSTHPDVAELMDAFCGPDGMDAVREVMDRKIKNAQQAEAPAEEADRR